MFNNLRDERLTSFDTLEAARKDLHLPVGREPPQAFGRRRLLGQPRQHLMEGVRLPRPFRSFCLEISLDVDSLDAWVRTMTDRRRVPFASLRFCSPARLFAFRWASQDLSLTSKYPCHLRRKDTSALGIVRRPRGTEAEPNAARNSDLPLSSLP